MWTTAIIYINIISGKKYLTPCRLSSFSEIPQKYCSLFGITYYLNQIIIPWRKYIYLFNLFSAFSETVQTILKPVEVLIGDYEKMIFYNWVFLKNILLAPLRGKITEQSLSVWYSLKGTNWWKIRKIYNMHCGYYLYLLQVNDKFQKKPSSSVIISQKYRKFHSSTLLQGVH